MVLRELVTRTEQIDDLRDLFGALGFKPAWETVPPGPWLGAAQAAAAGVRRAALVARHEAYRVFGLEAEDPERAARSAAQRLAQGAERGLACALGVGGRSRLLVCATWRHGGGAPLGVRTLAVPLDRVPASFLAALERCAPLPGETSLALALRVAEAAIERALAVERRVAAKVAAQQAAGAAQIESPSGQVPGAAGLDWCDRLHSLAAQGAPPAPAGACAAVRGHEPAVVLIIRIGALVEALVVVGEATVADPLRATHLLKAAASGPDAPLDRQAIEAAIRRAAPLVRTRLAAVATARWRAGDRDRLARRLIPWVLAAGRRAARRRDALELARLDGLISRLALGMTAGEEELLEELLGRRAALAIGDVLAWHERLPPPREPSEAPRVELVAALAIGPAAPCQRSGVAEQ